MIFIPPRVFISYSHDTDLHRDWVLALATRLVANGVDIILDQWDLTLGSDLPRFMEAGLTGADRVLAICTENYVNKANGSQGGVGYEKMILSAQVMRDVSAGRIIPVVRDNSLPSSVPTFLYGRVYVDFRVDALYETRYAELLHELHGQRIKPRPPLGANPFSASSTPIIPSISFAPERYVSPGETGVVTFDFSDNNGKYVVGAGDYAFETIWSGNNSDSMQVYHDAPSIKTIALAIGVRSIDELGNATLFNTSSRVRRPKLGEIVIWQNTAGYYLATKIESVKSRSHGSDRNEVTFSYVIKLNKSPSFIN